MRGRACRAGLAEKYDAACEEDGCMIEKKAGDYMKKRHRLRKLLGILFVILLLAAAGAAAYFGIRGYDMYRTATEQESIAERVEEIRSMEHFTYYEELADFYIDAVISAEDHRFESHPGIDVIAICRAAWTDLRTLSFKEGGSTITQQLAKNMLFSQEKSIDRKVAEVFAALALEADYSKKEIFELYVNTLYFGSGYYGIYEAAEGYFDKLPAELTDYEAAMLAGIPNAPSVYSPDENGELAMQRTEQVLSCMVRNACITQEEAEKIQMH
ncbi:transglycosylase [Marvinbryantia formatexigens DSM 14469]|uniref:Penicillin-binding protein 1A n=2 Tax=Marvinbryantia TaxID=248744 RepID=C6LBL1_9FIRM|nr:transglycosylase [Marvinbryantia formatexigens DSM 14469]